MSLDSRVPTLGFQLPRNVNSMPHYWIGVLLGFSGDKTMKSCLPGYPAGWEKAVPHSDLPWQNSKCVGISLHSNLFPDGRNFCLFVFSFSYG